MSYAVFIKVNSLTSALASKVHNFGSDQLMVALTLSAPLVTNTQLSNLSEISYTNISSRVLTLVSSAQVNGLYTLILASLTLTASGAVGPFRYATIYNNTATNKELLGFYDAGTSISMTSGQVFLLSLDQTKGVFQFG